jgi:hypothetical protein
MTLTTIGGGLFGFDISSMSGVLGTQSTIHVIKSSRTDIL